MKKIVDYIMYFFLMCLSVGQIIFVFLDTTFSATVYDKISTLLNNMPLFFLPFCLILIQKMCKENKQHKITKLLIHQIALFLPSIIIEIIRVINVIGKTTIIPLSDIIDVTIILLLPLSLLMLMLKKRKAYIVGKVLIIILVIAACGTQVITSFENNYCNLIVSLIIYALSVYPVLSLTFEYKQTIKNNY